MAFVSAVPCQLKTLNGGSGEEGFIPSISVISDKIELQKNPTKTKQEIKCRMEKNHESYQRLRKQN